MAPLTQTVINICSQITAKSTIYKKENTTISGLKNTKSETKIVENGIFFFFSLFLSFLGNYQRESQKKRKGTKTIKAREPKLTRIHKLGIFGKISDNSRIKAVQGQR